MPPDPSIVLLLGEPVTRSLSPGMQNVAFAALGIDCQYMPREVDRAGLAGVIDELRADEHILGANVTIPHKESVIAYLDELDPQAARIGAVNTISRQGSTLKGWNTDVEGFQRALAEQSGKSPSPLRGRVGVGATAPPRSSEQAEPLGRSPPPCSRPPKSGLSLATSSRHGACAGISRLSAADRSR